MIKFNIICEISISNRCGSTYKGITFDGCNFYLTRPQCCDVIKLDNQFCECESFETMRPYTCICYDIERGCFWASASNCNNRLFKLDCEFNEVDCIKINYCSDFGGNVTGISYDCANNQLLVAFARGIVSIDLCEPKKYEVFQESCVAFNTGVLSISPSFIRTEIGDSKQSVSIYGSDNKLRCKMDTPKEYVIEAIILDPCCSCNEKKERKHRFYALATKKCCYSYILVLEIDCSCLKICDCNFWRCDSRCGHNPNSPCSDNAFNDIIESVALIETSIAHILNAEGEKLQKIIANSDDIDKILCANKAVSKMVVDVTHLEIILHDKIVALKDICHNNHIDCDCCDDCNDYDHCEGCCDCNDCDDCNM